jgi:hypothetical protein
MGYHSLSCGYAPGRTDRVVRRLQFFDNHSEDRPIVPLFAVALAVIVWLIGFGCRYVSNARDAARLRHDTKRV